MLYIIILTTLSERDISWLETLVFSIPILLESLSINLISPLVAFFKVYYITKYNFGLRILLRRWVIYIMAFKIGYLFL
jgi:hypothetical protein